jgi:hypothetical protein
MKMEQTECSETSAYKIQTPGNYPEENILIKPATIFIIVFQTLPLISCVGVCMMSPFQIFTFLVPVVHYVIKPKIWGGETCDIAKRGVSIKEG